MKRLMSFARNLGSETREACKCFPLTMSATFVVGILICVIEKMRWIPERILWNSVFFFFLVAVGSYLTETIFVKKGRNFWYAEAIATVISTVGTFFFAIQNGMEYFQNREIVWGGSGRYLMGYCIIVGIIAIYIWYRRSGLGMESYCIGILQQFGKVTLIFILISLGCLILSRIFSSLILDRQGFAITDSLLGLTVTFFYIPSLAMIWKEQTDKIGVFLERIVKFVFLPMSVISGVIMYLYVMKLLIPLTIPSNQIFRMVTILFVGGAATWTLLGYYEDDNWYMRLAEKLPYFYLPFLVIQGYTLGVRLAFYGLTPNRCFGVLILLFEFMYLSGYRMLKERVAIIFLVYAVLIFLATWVPGINVEAVSIRNQKAIAEQYFTMADEDKEQKDWKRIYGAYQWLAQQPECMGYVDSIFSEEIVEEMQRQSGLMPDAPEGTYWLYDTKLVQSIDVAGYQTVIPVHSVQKSYGPELNITENILKSANPRDDLTKVMCQPVGVQGHTDDVMILNLQKVFDSYVQYYQQCQFERTDETHKYMEEHNFYALSDQQAFCVDAIEIVLDKNKKEIIQYSISGYLLEK